MGILNLTEPTQAPGSEWKVLVCLVTWCRTLCDRAHDCVVTWKSLGEQTQTVIRCHGPCSSTAAISFCALRRCDEGGGDVGRGEREEFEHKYKSAETLKG